MRRFRRVWISQIGTPYAPPSKPRCRCCGGRSRQRRSGSGYTSDIELDLIPHSDREFSITAYGSTKSRSQCHGLPPTGCPSSPCPRRLARKNTHTSCVPSVTEEKQWKWRGPVTIPILYLVPNATAPALFCWRLIDGPPNRKTCPYFKPETPTLGSCRRSSPRFFEGRYRPISGWPEKILACDWCGEHPDFPEWIESQKGQNGD